MITRKRKHESEKVQQQCSSYINECEVYVVELHLKAEKFTTKPSPDGISRLLKWFRYDAPLFGRRVVYPFRKETLQKLERNITDTISRLNLASHLLKHEDLHRINENTNYALTILELVKADHVKSDILHWFRAPDAKINFSAAYDKRHPYTGRWLVNGDAFKSWLDKPNSFIWIYGSTGTEKSILASTAIREVFLCKKTRPGIGIAFFFFKFDDETKQDASGMLRGLILQLSSQCEDTHDLDALYVRYRDTAPPYDALIECLKQIVSRFRDVYLILDALDECPLVSNREAMLDTLVQLHNSLGNRVHILATSREEIDIKDAIGSLLDGKIPMRNQEVQRDIALFIKDRLNSSSLLKRWEAYHIRIEAVLTQRANNKEASHHPTVLFWGFLCLGLSRSMTQNIT